MIIKNITHVTMRLPYIENKLLKTGNIRIESAGSSAAELIIRDIPDYKEFYETLKKYY